MAGLMSGLRMSLVHAIGPAKLAGNNKVLSIFKLNE
jgi:hypothetical protein